MESPDNLTASAKEFLTPCAPGGKRSRLRRGTGRPDPLIDLGIALVGNSTETIKRVEKRGGLGIRCTKFANPR